MKPLRCALLVTVAGMLAFTSSFPARGEAGAADPPASLSELLQQVRQGRLAQSRELRQREARFRAARDRQRALLAEAKAERAAQEKRSAQLEQTFNANEEKLAQLEALLKERLGTLGELFGVVRQVAGDTRAQLRASITSAQLPGRAEKLASLAESKELPTLEELEQLWYLMLQEIAESGRVARFQAEVLTPAGQREERTVVRVGPFEAVSRGRFLVYLPETGELAELARQPARRYRQLARDLERARTGFVRMAIDPSRGSLLALLVQTPSLRERIDQGGLIGYVILAIGAAGLLLVVERLVRLGRLVRRVRQQRTDPSHPRPDNPLGRVLRVYEENRDVDLEALTHKLDEAILRETPAIERGVSSIRVLAAIAPLLGLLGTVTGMIQTFQAITLFGSGDPKLMAGGISQALVTTVLGLCVAIPLVLLHSFVQGRSQAILQILEEESAGLVAARVEAEEGTGGSA